MCLTRDGLELTRLSIVDSDLQVLFDGYVLPKSDIVDYNTRYSGITAAHLDGVTMRLEDAREKLMGVIGEETVLVGHSLENDLKALKVRGKGKNW